MKNNIFDQDPYSFSTLDKDEFILENIAKLTKHHYINSIHYKKILNFTNFDLKKKHTLDEYPFLPVRLFKHYDLMSIKQENIFKKLTSSGTTGNELSKIYLDHENAFNQTKVLSKIINSLFENKRLPMLIIDKDIAKIDRNKFNAKIAAIKGFSIFGKNHTYLLDKSEKINYDAIDSFLEKYGNSSFFVFGFTSSIYKYLLKQPLDHKKKYDFSKGILLHGGGWKKMENEKINNRLFKKLLNNKFKLKKIHNYYGLIEQTGSIFIECPICDSFIVSIFSDVIIRDKHMRVLPSGKPGFIQLISLLPKSYPGHIILTEDIGKIVENDCSCKSKGKRFQVIGRSKESEIRGCSDT